MKNLTLDEIRALPAAKIVEGLRKRDFSLLQSMGFHKLRAEMNFTGFVCRTIIGLTGLRKEVKKRTDNQPVALDSPARKRVEKLLKKAAPCMVKGYFPHPKTGLVVGFNHPSLGEILRFIYLCVTEYHERLNLFPVNLPWYEAIMPIVNELEAIGVYVMPVITPSTRRKMAKKADSETMEVIDSVSMQLNALYLEECVSFVKRGDAIWVAPSATRQRTVFQSVGCSNGTFAISPQTMTLLVLNLKRKRVEDCKILPVGVRPPDGFGRGLNLFKKYKLCVGEPYSFATASELARAKCTGCQGSQFELNFLQSVSGEVAEIGGLDLIAPDVF